jgi:antitoxin CptB
MNDKSRLAWRCRRGMREMDILFEKFVQKEYDRLTREQKQLFDRFLDEPDADIYAWITGKNKPHNEAYNFFIRHLQDIHN